MTGIHFLVLFLVYFFFKNKLWSLNFVFCFIGICVLLALIFYKLVHSWRFSLILVLMAVFIILLRLFLVRFEFYLGEREWFRLMLLVCYVHDYAFFVPANVMDFFVAVGSCVAGALYLDVFALRLQDTLNGVDPATCRYFCIFD